MSYSRFDDQHDDGWVSQFCERLSAEVRVQLGEEFPIFQDRNDIAWGQSWQQRIDQALDAVTLLLVIITPGFFRSSPCREEVERFLARERDLGREDLILPLYYVSTPELDDAERRNVDSLAQVLASRQFADWRELRFEPLTSPKARKAVAQLAARMRDTFWRQTAKPSSGPREQAYGEPGQSQSAEAAPAARATAKTDLPTHVADSSEVGRRAKASEGSSRTRHQEEPENVILPRSLYGRSSEHDLGRLALEYSKRLFELTSDLGQYDDASDELVSNLENIDYFLREYKAFVESVRSSNVVRVQRRIGELYQLRDSAQQARDATSDYKVTFGANCFSGELRANIITIGRTNASERISRSFASWLGRRRPC